MAFSFSILQRRAFLNNNISAMCMYWIYDAIFDVCLDRESPENIRDLRLNAMMGLPNYLSSYARRDLNSEVIEMVCREKLRFLKQAATGVEIREIMSPPRPRWHAGKVICDSPYHIDAEELLIWSHFSPSNLMPPEAAERCLSLFEKVFGCSVEDYMKTRRNET